MNALHQLYQKSICRYNEYAITSISGVRDFGTFEYTKENLARAAGLLKQGALKRLTELTPAKNLLGKDLTVIRFRDQESKEYVALFYDSGDWSEDPEIILIYPYYESS